ncbi:MAG: LysR family transcriptional regulator [Alphaproteobacteria bacterium]
MKPKGPDTLLEQDDRLLFHLECLKALAELRHFGAAAKRMGLSQPAFSQAIKALEAACGVVIVQRTRRFEGLTADGEVILNHADRILGDVRSLGQTLAARRTAGEAPLRFGTVPSTTFIATMITRALQQNLPGLPVLLEEATGPEIAQMLQDRQMVAAVSYLLPKQADGVLALALYEESYALLVPDSWDLGVGGPVDWKTLAPHPLGLMQARYQFRQVVEDAFASSDMRPNVAVESNSLMALVTQASLGACAVPVPAVFAKAMRLPAGIRALPLPPPPRRHAVGLLIAPEWVESAIGTAIIGATEALRPTFTSLT